MASLLRLHAEVQAELRARGIARTSNNPVADYAEWLTASVLKLKLENNSAAGYDATDSKSRRYEIKALRRNAAGKAPQFSDFRNLSSKRFDHFVAVIFNHDFTVERALMVSHATVLAGVGSFRKHKNAHVLLNTPRLWNAPDAIDLTQRFQRRQARAPAAASVPACPRDVAALLDPD